MSGLTPAQIALQHAARQLNGTENVLGWAKADLAHRAQADNVPEWYVICAKEFDCRERYCFALAKTAAFYAVIRTLKGWRRDALQFSAWAACAAYWGRKGIELDVLLDVMDEAVSERVSVAEFEQRLLETFGEQEWIMRANGQPGLFDGLETNGR
jgi:hypothetical protein